MSLKALSLFKAWTEWLSVLAQPVKNGGFLSFLRFFPRFFLFVKHSAPLLTEITPSASPSEDSTWREARWEPGGSADKQAGGARHTHSQSVCVSERVCECVCTSRWRRFFKVVQVGSLLPDLKGVQRDYGRATGNTQRSHLNTAKVSPRL